MIPYTQFGRLAPTTPEEEQESLIGQILGFGASGLQTAGNILDTAGGPVRSLLAGNEPFSAITDPQARPSGRDVLEKWGVLSPNTPGIDLGDVAGVGFEVATDPLTYATFGASALTKAGKLARKAGLMGDMARYKRAVNVGGKMQYPSAARLRSTLTPRALTTPLSRSADDVAEAAKRLADLTGVADRAGVPLHQIMDQPLGGAFGFNIPFTDMSWVPGGAAQEFAVRASEKVANAFQWLPYARTLRRAVDSRVMDTQTRAGQHVSPTHFDLATGGLQRAEEAKNRFYTAVKRVTPDHDPNILRAQLEGMQLGRTLNMIDDTGNVVPVPAMHQELVQPAQDLLGLVNQEVDESKRLGMGVRRQKGYFHGAGTFAPEADPTKARFAPAADVPRSLVDNMHQLIKGKADKKDQLKIVRDVLDANGFSSQGPRGGKVYEFVDLKGKIQKGRDHKILGWLTNPKRTMEESQTLFGNHPLFDFSRRHSYHNVATGRGVENQRMFLDDEFRDLLWQDKPDDTILKGDAALRKQWSPVSVRTAIKRTRMVDIDYRDVLLDHLVTMTGKSRYQLERLYKRQGQAVSAFERFWDEVVGLNNRSGKNFDPNKVIGGRLARQWYNVGVRDGWIVPTRTGSGNMALPQKLVADKVILDAIRAGDKRVGGALMNMMEMRGTPIRDQASLDAARSWAKDTNLPEHFIKDLTHIQKPVKDPLKYALLEPFDAFSSIWKAGVLTHPARNVRDFVSGAVQNLLKGHLNPLSAPGANLDMYRVLGGKAIQGLEDIPHLQEMLAARRLPPTAGNLAEMLRQDLQSRDLVGRFAGEWRGMASPEHGSWGAMTHEIPGEVPFTWKEVGKKAIGTSKSTSLNPAEWLRAMGRGDRSFSNVPLVSAGHDVSFMTDALNRGSAYLNLLKKGVHPDEATRLVKDAQLDYGWRNFTPIERDWLMRIFPFYRFAKGSAKSTLGELLRRPGGGTAQALRATNLLQGDEQVMPSHLTQSMAVPLPPGKSGHQRYLASLGLMHEDPLQILGGGPAGTGMELLSRLNPLAKVPLELVTGKSFFQRGPEGARDIEDLDPVLGRILQNLGEEQDVHKQALPIGGSRLLETLAINSPLSRALTSARVATDPRKETWAKLVNLLSGARISDVSPASLDAALSDALSAELKQNPEAREFTRLYIPEERLETMKKEDVERAAKAETILAAIANLAEKAKERKEARKKEAK